jgi:uncharacterized radical SAM superfamily Fe-S cluster-containing enzyme
VKVDRDEVCLEYTKSICPVYKTVVDAEVSVRDKPGDHAQALPRTRPVRGARLLGRRALPGAAALHQAGHDPARVPDQGRRRLPLDCGLCPEHKQHAWLGIIEVNSGCNLDRPICFADSGHHPGGCSLTLEQVDFMFDRFVAAEGSPEVVQFSGGEPTIHPQILDFIELAGTKGIRVVMLNTNGIRIARDARFARALGCLNPHVYLQFDGFELETHLTIRGKDLRSDKQCALDRCADGPVAPADTVGVEPQQVGLRQVLEESGLENRDHAHRAGGGER